MIDITLFYYLASFKVRKNKLREKSCRNKSIPWLNKDFFPNCLVTNHEPPAFSSGKTGEI